MGHPDSTRDQEADEQCEAGGEDESKRRSVLSAQRSIRHFAPGVIVGRVASATSGRCRGNSTAGRGYRPTEFLQGREGCEGRV